MAVKLALKKSITNHSACVLLPVCALCVCYCLCVCTVCVLLPSCFACVCVCVSVWGEMCCIMCWQRRWIRLSALFKQIQSTAADLVEIRVLQRRKAIINAKIVGVSEGLRAVMWCGVMCPAAEFCTR